MTQATFASLPGADGARSPLDSALLAAGAGKDQVELYLRTFGTLLRSSGELRLRTLEATHIGMHSSLHSGAGLAEPDLGAFIYATQRLPSVMPRVRHVVMGQTPESFAQALGEDVGAWQQVAAPGRRRRCHFDGRDCLAVFIASQSDVDDLIPTLVAWQIEWNKLHALLRGFATGNGHGSEPEAEPWRLFGGVADDWRRLQAIWGTGFTALLADVARGDLNLTVRMLGGTHVGYAQATARWWQPIANAIAREGLDGRPIYFVSSNTHSLVNLLSGVALRHQEAIIEHVEQAGERELAEELAKLRSGASRGNWHNFLYYAARSFFRERPERQQLRLREEHARGIAFVPPHAAIEVAAQIIALDRLHPKDLDPRLGTLSAARLRASRAIVVNIDYPLGMAAYNIMRAVMERTGELRGVYVLGKAATLNASVGDVMIPDVVHDEHSMNTYWLDNCFSYEDVGPFLVFGSALDHQRAVTVKGTFLQNKGYLDLYHRESYTAVEMEAGPYLDALYEGARADRYPEGQSINFAKLPFDLGVIHYASDTPYTQARTLGARALDYRGIDSTYASAVAILRRVLVREGVTAAAEPANP
ncbi:MAG TPA: hypothetical protein VKV26_21890 [Dehalococcoidia bacterium]|nr:hypothetical protein [Dehalococcoidia bacterium]